MKYTIIAMLISASFAQHVHANELIEHTRFPEPLQDLRPLALEAIKNGGAEGILGGDAAKFIYNKMGATELLRVKVTRLFRYNQEGCARLNAQFKQNNVTLPGEKVARDREVNFQFNYCMDGRPPKTEGMEYVVNSPFTRKLQPQPKQQQPSSK